MTNIHKFKWKGISISNWFYKIALNEIRMYQRKNKYQPASLEALFEDGFEVADEYEFTQELIDAQDALNRQAQYIQARAVLLKLPLKYQEVITLRFAEEKKISDIAQILDKKEGTVKSLLSRALTKLRKELEQSAVQPNAGTGIIPSAIGQEAYEE